MKNFLKKYKIILIVILVLIIGVVIGVVAFKIFGKENKSEAFTQALAEDIVTNNYLISYLLYGDVQADAGEIELDGETYYGVSDELLSDINSVADINSLIRNTILEAGLENVYAELANEANNQYVGVESGLYVKKNNTCLTDTLNLEGLTYTVKEDDRYWINTEEIGYNVYLEDENWKSMKLIYTCGEAVDEE